jgi:DNA-binding NarL/FixJ family response regulator
MATASLSPRETDVLDGLARGLTNSEIAAELHLSTSTVKSYLRTAFKKIGASNRTQAAMYVLTTSRE